MNVIVKNGTFGKNLLFLRKKYRLSRIALAKLTGTAAVLICAWEEGRVYPTLSSEMVKRLCVILQVDRNTLLSTDLEAE